MGGLPLLTFIFYAHFIHIINTIIFYKLYTGANY